MAFMMKFQECLKESDGNFTPALTLLVNQSMEILEALKDEDFIFLKRVVEKVRTKNVESQIWNQADYKLNLVEQRHGKRRLNLAEQAGQEDFQKILEKAKDMNAEALHIKSHRKPYLKSQGQLIQLKDETALDKEQMLERLANTLTGQQYSIFKSLKSVSFSLSLTGISRFKVFAYWENGLPAVSFKQIPLKLPKAEEIRIPNKVIDVLGTGCGGIIVLGGPATSGVSTTAAALIQWINENRSDRVLCIEDPIEYLFQDQKSSITQRELNADLTDSIDGLKHAIRDGSDVIFLTEISNAEVLEWVLNASESGHLVICGIAASGVKQSLQKIASWYQKAEQFVYLERLSQALIGVLNQRLVTGTSGSLLAIYELLILNPATRTMIRQSNWQPLKNYLDAAKDGYSFSFAREFARMITEGFISEEQVIESIPSYEDFKLMQGRLGDTL